MPKTQFFDNIFCRTVACLGDSITAGCFDEEGLGWVARLSALLNQNTDDRFLVYNFGTCNDTVLEAGVAFASSVTKTAPEILIIHIGVNDNQIKRTDVSEQTRISLMESATRWFNLLNKAKKEGYKTLVIPPLPVACDEIQSPPFPDNPAECKTIIVRNKDISAYDKMLCDLCERLNVPYLNLYEQWLGKDLYTDGLHPTAKGHKLLSEQIFAELVRLGWV